ncbi:MAG: phosphoribosyltransferase family protein [bacterium]|nr:phosphoribosyltransferase family protein [bacterium]
MIFTLEQQALEILNEVSAVITNSHVVYASGKHGSAYVNKDAIYPHTLATSRLCGMIAQLFFEEEPEVVVAPAIGGVILSQWVAYNLTDIRARAGVDHLEVLGVYAEHEEKSLLKLDRHEGIMVGDTGRLVFIEAGWELLIKKPSFVIKRGYDKLVAGRKILVVEDVLTTGQSAKMVVEAVRALGGNVVGLAALCNRGGITAEQVGNPPKFVSLVNVKLDAFDEIGCPLCAAGVPINTEVGKGKAFLARQQAAK